MRHAIVAFATTFAVAATTSASAAAPRQCVTWRSFQGRYPHCDPPGAAGRFAVNLTAVFGPICDKNTPWNECCHQPLGYDSGPPFGTSCREACSNHDDRRGTDANYCSKSDGSSYGKCAMPLLNPSVHACHACSHVPCSFVACCCSAASAVRNGKVWFGVSSCPLVPKGYPFDTLWALPSRPTVAPSMWLTPPTPRVAI